MFIKYNKHGDAVGPTGTGIFAIFAVLALLITVPMSFETVSKGTVKVGYRFGAYTETLSPGFHFPVNPLVSWTEIDTMQKTEKQENVELPSRDQLTSRVDISIQYRAIASEGNNIINETGSVEQVVDVHMLPKIRSLIREAGRSVNKAEDLYTDTEVSRISIEMTDSLREFMAKKGIAVEAVLVRNITLPEFINNAIQSKKEREQQAERQKAELARFETEQQQKVKQARAERDAAVLAAEQVKILADAKAYEIEKVNEAAAKSPMYLQLEAVRAFGQLGNDPSSKIVIMDGSSAKPFPFLNIGEVIAPATNQK